MNDEDYDRTWNETSDETWKRHLKIHMREIAMTPEIKMYNTKWDEEIEIDVKRMKHVSNKELLCQLLSTYCDVYDCDGYIQGMNCVAFIFMAKIGARAAFWGLGRFMGNVRYHLHCFDLEAHLQYCNKWESLFHEFSDGMPTDEEHVMPLKYGIYAFSTTNTTPENLFHIWDALVKLPHEQWIMFTAAVAAAACRRYTVKEERRRTERNNDPRILHSILNFNNAKQLVRRANRMILHKKTKFNYTRRAAVFNN